MTKLECDSNQASLCFWSTIVNEFHREKKLWPMITNCILKSLSATKSFLYPGEKQRTIQELKACEYNSLLLLEKWLRLMSHKWYMTVSPSIKTTTELISLLGLCIHARMGISMQNITEVFMSLFQGVSCKFCEIGKESSKLHNVL